LNGAVKPADSLNFPDPEHGNVSEAFYQWAEQMFLWLTSPSAKQGGDGPKVFTADGFYTVSERDEKGKRTFHGNANDSTPLLALRAEKAGPHGLPIIVDKKGSLFELEPTTRAKDKKPVVWNKDGEVVEVDRITRDAFLDSDGKPIPNPRPIIGHGLGDSPIVQRFTFGDFTVYLNQSGDKIELGAGQGTTNDVLLTQNSSPVYYMISVNDVYAYFLTATKGTPDGVSFLTCKPALEKIIAFAGAHGKPLYDANALCVEVKTSWVEADQLPDKGRGYITMTGTIPCYDRCNPTRWVRKGTTCARLALVGMHVAGSTRGHPEMIWATFEHFGNTPNDVYAYNSIIGQNPKTVCRDTSGSWLFCRAGAQGNFNLPRQSFSGGDIVATGTGTIGPSDTIRFKPFGAALDQPGNFLAKDSAASNTPVISINNSVRRRLADGDVRKNYYMLGAAWTIGGGSPLQGAYEGRNVVGTGQLANSTMETFTQVGQSFAPSGSCFHCHMTNTTSVSLIFNDLEPLP
jgi:hypothetical protein